MIMNSRGKRLWIVDETGQVQPVGSYADITGKARDRNLPDWWVEERDPDWTPPPPTSLLSLTAANVGHVEAWAGGGAGGMKIGAGHKPQPYDDHGRYTGPTGASISMDGGTIRTFSADAEEPEEWQGNEPEGGQEDGQEESAQDAQQRVEEMARELQRAADELEAARQQAQGVGQPLNGVQIADSGQIKSDAGGLSGGPEVRGPVTGPSEWREPLQQREDQAQRVPTSVFWKNREEAHGLKPQMNDAVNSMRQDVPKMDSVFVSSGRREALEPGDPHAEGRGLDISKINGHPVSGLETSTAPGADRAREAAANLEEWARNNKDVNQIIGPNGGGEIKEGSWREIPPTDPRVQGHQNHYHINVRR